MDWGRHKRGLERRINRFRPLRRVAVAELAEACPEDWDEVFPAWRAKWPEHLVSGPLPQCMRSRLSDQLPPRGVLVMRDARVWRDDGWVFLPDDRVVSGLGIFVNAGRWTPRVHLPLFFGGPKLLRGRTLSLLSDWASCNFYHILLEMVPRVEMLRAAGWVWDDFDQILLPGFRSPIVDRMLAQLGLPEEKVIRIGWGDFVYYLTEELVCTSFPGGWRTVTPQQVAFVRSLVSTETAQEVGRGRKLFVCRRAPKRRLRNEAELQERLEAMGFETVDPGSLKDTEACFRSADCVVGLHGAAMANLVFCRPGTRVLELLSSAQSYPYYLSLSLSGGLIYDCVIGPADHEVPSPHPLAVCVGSSDYVVDIDEVLASLNRLLAMPSVPQKEAH